MKQADNPSIAIVIPVYNMTAFLQEAIDSALSQSLPASEIIVVDDGSGPEAAEIIRKVCSKDARITLLVREHEGVAAARHAGAQQSGAEYIVFLDGDDTLTPDAFACFAEGIKKHPAAHAVYARRVQVDKQGNIIAEPKPDAENMVFGLDVLAGFLKLVSPFVVGSACIKREALLRHSNRHTHLVLGEDWALWCYLALSGTIMPAGEQVVLHYRRHGENTTLTFKDNPQAVFDAYDAIFNDKKFMDVLGEKKLAELRQYCHQHTHMVLARYFAKQGEKEKAQQHMQQLALSVSDYLKLKN